jgi:hypothetical protein
MKRIAFACCLVFASFAAVLALAGATPAARDAAFPAELVKFAPYEGNPVFEAEGPGHWDVRIRERGWILREGDTYHLWYTGYDGTAQARMMLGYATSRDGLHWRRYPDNPIYRDHWVEDMMVVKHGDTYYMFAEGLHDRAQLLTSTDRVHWTRQGQLDIRYRNGEPLSEGPYGTPTAWVEGDRWYLFYERRDLGIWLAVSKDLKVWTNVQDEPVIKPGRPGPGCAEPNHPLPGAILRILSRRRQREAGTLDDERGHVDRSGPLEKVCGQPASAARAEQVERDSGA